MNIQVIWAHPRADSLTAVITADILNELEHHGTRVDELDLYRSGFNGVLYQDDEPSWSNPQKHYSPEVSDHASRTKQADAVIFVFPVWWYSLPALLKGFIDRVWNYGLLYGEGSEHFIRAVRWIGLTGHPREQFEKRNYVEMMAHHLNTGIASYCGIENSKLKLLHNTLGEDLQDMTAHVDALKHEARNAARDLVDELRGALSNNQTS